MGKEYRLGYNPFRDYLMRSLHYGVDISDKKMKEPISNTFQYFLENILNDPKDAVHLDFDIKGDDEWYSVKGLNLVSALWLSGIFPKNISLLMKDNEYELDGILYKFNKRTKKLKFTEIDE